MQVRIRNGRTRAQSVYGEHPVYDGNDLDVVLQRWRAVVVGLEAGKNGPQRGGLSTPVRQCWQPALLGKSQ